MPERCGAKTRNGTPCKNWGMSNGRCRLHGGMTPTSNGALPGNTNAIRHGVYRKGFSDAEKLLLPGFRGQIGCVDEELCIARLMLHRALEAQEVVRLSRADNPANIETLLAEMDGKIESPPHAGTNFWAVIDTCLGRVAHLETVRQNLKLELVEGLQQKLERLLKAQAQTEPCNFEVIP